MIIEINIPKPGESISEVEIANWLVEDGAYVEKNQEIAVVESEKATLDIIAAESGTIKILILAGNTAAVGAVACTIDTEATGTKSTSTKEPAKISYSSPIIEKVTDQKQADVLNNIKITPVAKTMMEQNNLSVDDILSGLKRISKSDIEAVIANKTAVTETKSSVNISRETEKKKLTQLRKKLSERLVAVKNETAMLTTFNEIDMLAIIELRKKHQISFQAKHGVKLGFMSFFTKAVSNALAQYPNVNAIIDGEDLIYYHYTDISIAVQTDKGLMAPVLRNAETMSLAEIEKNIANLAEKARTNKITIDELSGGTFTITNGGVFGSLLSTPILNPPQSAILGMHNINDRPIAINGKVEIRPMMYIALSYDHRVIDGKDSVGFLIKVKEQLEHPTLLMSDCNCTDEKLLGL